jgi:transcriptional regulator with XRE-family HTH domain
MSVERKVLKSRLRMYRAAKGYSQLEMEDRAGLTRGAYWRIENGYQVPTDKELQRIARALCIPLETLTAPPSEPASPTSNVVAS